MRHLSAEPSDTTSSTLWCLASKLQRASFSAPNTIRVSRYVCVSHSTHPDESPSSDYSSAPPREFCRPASSPLVLILPALRYCDSAVVLRRQSSLPKPREVGLGDGKGKHHNRFSSDPHDNLPISDTHMIYTLL